MYGLPKDVDLSFLNSREVIQICVGIHQLVVNFDGDACISVESAIESQSDGDAVTWSSGSVSGASAILDVLGTHSRSITVSDNGCLELKFTNGSVLRIFDSNEDYESYELHGPDKHIIV